MNKLFIFIPTYNRPNALATQLEVLIPQAIEFKDHVRIVVRDNDSDADGLWLVREKYVDIGNITFEKNHGNIDANANISLGFVFAKENEFLWILSDNDVVHKLSVACILGAVTSNIDFIVCTDEVLQPTQRKWKWIDGWEIPMDWGMGLISRTLFNTNSVRSSLSDAFYYHNSSFPHLAVAISTAKKMKEVEFLLLPLNNILSETISVKECPGNYSLSSVGMPQLLPLLPTSGAKSFALGWAHRHGADFYLHRSRWLALFVSSKYLLVLHGGSRVLIYLLMGRFLSSEYFFVKVLKEAAKRNFSKGVLDFLRHLIYG